MVEAISIHHHHALPPPDPDAHSKPLHLRHRTRDTSSQADTGFSTINVGIGSNIISIDGPITIGQFSDAVQLSLANSRATLHQDDLSSTLLNKKVGQGQGDLVFSLLAVRAAIADLQAQTQALVDLQNQQIEDMNTATTTYNNATADDQNETDTMNQAIADYNNGDITDAEFNDAVDHYNAYVDGTQPFRDTYNAAVATFQGQVTANNETIAAINAQGAQYQITPIADQMQIPSTASPLPHQDLAPLPLPVSSLPNPAGPMAELDPIPQPPSQASYLHDFWNPIANLALIALAVTNRRQDVHQAYSDFLTFFIRGKRSTEANAFSNSLPGIFFDSTGGISGGSTGIATSPVGTGVSNPHVAGLLAAGIFDANSKQYNIQMTQPLLNHFALFGVQRATSGGLEAALPGLRLIGSSALTSAQSVTAFGVAIGISYAQVVATLISSDKVKVAATAYVNQELRGSQADQQTIDRTIEVTTALTNLFLLQTALLVSANTAKLPGLPGQIFSNVGGITSEGLHKQSPQTIAQVLNDPLKQVFLKTTLSAQLAGDTNIQNEKAQTLINTAINTSIAAGPVRTAEEFKHRLIKNLTDEGISRREAVALANQAQGIVKAEQTSQHIVNSDLYDRTKASSELTTQLVQGGYNVFEAALVAKQAIDQTLNNAAITNATEFQIALTRALENLNVNRAKADDASKTTVAALNVVPPGTSSLLNPFAATTLTPAELSREINANLVAALTPIVGPDTARHIANQAVTTFVGTPASDLHVQPTTVRPPGLLTLINDNVNLLRRYGDPRTNDRLTNQFRDFMLPNIDLLAFSNKITDPAYTFMHIAATGLMYTPVAEPTKDKKSIDIQV